MTEQGNTCDSDAEAKKFAQDLGLRLANPKELEKDPVSLLCYRLASLHALQALLWDRKLMEDLLVCLLGAGVIVIVQEQASEQIDSCFGNGFIIIQRASKLIEPAEYVALHLTIDPKLIPSDDPEQASQSTCPLSPQLKYALGKMADMGFISPLNEPDSGQILYEHKVRSWFEAGFSSVVDNETGIEYFADFRDGIWMLLSIGVQSASKMGCVSLYDFVYAGQEVEPTCFHDRIGIGTEPSTMVALREFLNDAVALLGGPSMALVHEVSIDSVGTLRYIKVELCRNVRIDDDRLTEEGDLSYIKRAPVGFTFTAGLDEMIAAKAMRCVHNDSYDSDIGRLFRSDMIPMDLYLKYDIAKAIRVVSHNRAIMRRRYAGIVAERKKDDLKLPCADTAEHRGIERTNLIREVDADGRVVQFGMVTLRTLGLISLIISGGAAFLISFDKTVNAAEIYSTGVETLVLLMVALPSIYATYVGYGHSVGDVYNGRAPMGWLLKRHGEGFLRECVSKGVELEGLVSGRHGCYMMGRASGSLRMGPVRIADLDSRWDYGVNDKGLLCLRYKSRVGDMQVLEEDKGGRRLRWWHCQVQESEIVKGFHPIDVIDHIGDGEVG